MSKADDIRRLMRTEGAAVAENTRAFNEGRYRSVADLEDYESLKDEARAVKEDAIERLPELVEELRESVEANGGTVYIADDAEDANDYIRSVVSDRDADRVVKSKSMTTEEIEVNDVLEADGVDVVETDLGEWVLQLAEEAPSHIVAPAIHKSREAIADLFDERFDPQEPLETAEDLTYFARERLGEQIVDAEVGMTGANFITADTGTMALVTSEGNARKTVAATDTQITVAGVEKVIPSVEDLQPFVELIGRSGTGQDITSYVSLLTPPVDTPVVDFDDDTTPLSEFDADREFHLVLIDNGRMEMREDEHLEETLYCIRCSACSNSCANFQSVGGHAFGGETYSGGIATGWEAGIEGSDTAAEFNDLCTGCTRCVNACPVKIDIPWINTVVRDRINRGDETEFDWLVEGLTPDEEPGGVDVQKRFFGNFETVAKLGSATAPLSNWLADTDASRWAMEKVLGIDPRRDLPEFERETLVEWFEKRGGAAASKERAARAERDSRATSPERRAVLYPDLYTNHVQVERGKAAVRALEALGVAVVVPSVASSGRAPFSQGMVDTAADHAERVTETLTPYVDDGYDVVVVEPSDHAMFTREYERLVDGDAFALLSENSYEVLEYVYGLLENGADADALATGDGEGIAYHSHCQQRTLGLETYTVAVLNACGYDVVTSDVECCGMAGSFGYKSEYYELSMDVGDRLRGQLEADGVDDRRVVASGTSCLEQIGALLERQPRHPVELLVEELPR
ncbi:LUD domain-containing protein [Halopelagius longus]|uniref:(4Fe-4S)-binding protein n=1 Tax=Halopelagius longus TaxID=1236180 RepID=A0A1H1G0A2_9EURY|nr:LUD domain-containing protein [Halopelagius longus]RDI69939.1 (4Fe-4S)-binding protein [Halopelagius longus]SDR06256.1 iron-sulfur cluster-binding protein [Halopelagius longus]